MSDTTFHTPDVTMFCRLDELGLVVVGQHVVPDRAVLECRVVAQPGDVLCWGYGVQGVVRDTVSRLLAHAPFGDGRQRC